MPYNVIFFFLALNLALARSVGCLLRGGSRGTHRRLDKAMWAATKHTYQLNQGKETTIDYVILKHHVNAL